MTPISASRLIQSDFRTGVHPKAFTRSNIEQHTEAFAGGIGLGVFKAVRWQVDGPAAVRPLPDGEDIILHAGNKIGDGFFLIGFQPDEIPARIQCVGGDIGRCPGYGERLRHIAIHPEPLTAVYLAQRTESLGADICCELLL